MKCQACDNSATMHVTEIVQGKPVEYHVCGTHYAQGLNSLTPSTSSPLVMDRGKFFRAFLEDPGLREAMRDARQDVAAYLLPTLCLALLDHKPEVRILAAFNVALHGADAWSAIGALRDALKDSDARVQKAAAFALEHIEMESPNIAGTCPTDRLI